MTVKTKEKMVIDWDEEGKPCHCGTRMQKAGGRTSGTKLCQSYRCALKSCNRIWVNVNEPFVPKSKDKDD